MNKAQQTTNANDTNPAIVPPNLADVAIKMIYAMTTNVRVGRKLIIAETMGRVGLCPPCTRMKEALASTLETGDDVINALLGAKVITEEQLEHCIYQIDQCKGLSNLGFAIMRDHNLRANSEQDVEDVLDEAIKLAVSMPPLDTVTTQARVNMMTSACEAVVSNRAAKQSEDAEEENADENVQVHNVHVVGGADLSALLLTILTGAQH